MHVFGGVVWGHQHERMKHTARQSQVLSHITELATSLGRRSAPPPVPTAMPCPRTCTPEPIPGCPLPHCYGACPSPRDVVIPFFHRLESPEHLNGFLEAVRSSTGGTFIPRPGGPRRLTLACRLCMGG